MILYHAGIHNIYSETNKQKKGKGEVEMETEYVEKKQRLQVKNSYNHLDENNCL